MTDAPFTVQYGDVTSDVTRLAGRARQGCLYCILRCSWLQKPSFKPGRARARHRNLAYHRAWLEISWKPGQARPGPNITASLAMTRKVRPASNFRKAAIWRMLGYCVAGAERGRQKSQKRSGIYCNSQLSRIVLCEMGGRAQTVCVGECLRAVCRNRNVAMQAAICVCNPTGVAWEPAPLQF